MKNGAFESIKLEEMDQVKLMNRMDTKFWFHQRYLPVLFKEITSHYRLLTINGVQSLAYSTVYFDTVNNDMYLDHHNGRLKRTKVRHRTYCDSGISFLEVKQKTLKGRTVKSRIPFAGKATESALTKRTFVKENLPCQHDDLRPVLQNNFNRLTLVSNKMNERCTVDLNLQFRADNNHVDMDNLVIVEVKTEGLPRESVIVQKLRNMHITSSGFSKYCVGRILTTPGLKDNAFKSKIHRLNKVMSN